MQQTVVTKIFAYQKLIRLLSYVVSGKVFHHKSQAQYIICRYKENYKILKNAPTNSNLNKVINKCLRLEEKAQIPQK